MQKDNYKKGAIHKPVPFSKLSKDKQYQILKKGAEHFSKNFTKVIVKLAND